jgi:hypothetical protein
MEGNVRNIYIPMVPMVPMVVNTKITAFCGVMLGRTIAMFEQNLRHTSSGYQYMTVSHLSAIITIFI